MKKILIFASILGLSACGIHAGDINIWPQRNAMFEKFESYDIEFFDNSAPVLVNVEQFSEIMPAKNELQRAYTGFSVFYDKKYKKSYYQECFVKANKDGVLSTASVPAKISKNETKQLVGRSQVDDKWYSLLPSELKSFVWMIDENGGVHNKMGQIKNDRLVVLTTDFVVTPADLSFQILTNTKVEQTIPKAGFDIKYGGTKLGRIMFTILDYSKYGRDRGEFENIYFDYKQNQNINVLGVKIKVLFADEQKLDYIILDY